MYNRHPDAVGNALGLYGGYGYGYGPYAVPVIGQGGGADEAAAHAAAAAAQGAAAMQQAAAAQAAFFGQWGCGLPPAQFDPTFPQRQLKSVVAGVQCGPLETETILPFDNAGVEIPAGGTYTLIATAQVPCKVIGIKFASPQASNFDILDGKTGIMPMFANQGVFSAVLVQENATSGVMNTVSLAVGQQARLLVKNTSPQASPLSPALRVVAVFFGGPQIYGGPVY